jgi:ABC-type nitrate/sulfonate/bicarbonate transport system permease component
MRPFVAFITKMRFLSLVGISIVFVMLADDLGTARIYLLMFGIVPYMTTSIVSVVDSTEKLRLDCAKTLGLSPWQQVWHIQIREKAGDIADVIRQNLAMAFMMLTFVELRVREGGGVGVLLGRPAQKRQRLRHDLCATTFHPLGGNWLGCTFILPDPACISIFIH